MAEEKTTEEKKNPDSSAQHKSKVIETLFSAIEKANGLLSFEDLNIAMESLRVASLEAKQRDELERRRRQAEIEARKRAEEEARRQAALRRAQRREERKHRAHVKEVTCMDLPMDWHSSFENDERANVHFDNIPDAFMFCLDSLGEVDIEFISTITGADCKTVISELKGSIYQNPLTWKECFYKGWETADDYLSGNIMYKYKVAKDENKKYLGYFDANEKALKDLLSPDISTDDIYVTLGSPWVPENIIDHFILHLIGKDPIDGRYDDEAMQFLQPEYRVVHDSVTGLWEIPKKTRFRAAYLHGRYTDYNYNKYGTHRMDMLYLLENILNMRTLAIEDPIDVEGKKKVINKEETIQVLERQERLINEFQKWVWLESGRAQKLKVAYNSKYGNIRKRKYDGAFLKFPNMNQNIQLYDYQKDAVARILFSKNTLLAHEVGSGKTYEMIAAGMELRRLGKSKKNLYIVPNSILSSWENIFHQMYPNANVLVVNNDNFNFKNRGETLERIMNEDFDGVLMTYSCFDRLPLSDKYYIEMYSEMLEKLKKAEDYFNSKAKIERKKAKITRLLDELKRKVTKNSKSVHEITFDELGINTMFVDEAHNYKNVELQTSITRVLGLGGGSVKGTAMMDKVHCVQRQNDGGRIIFATGTPITNSITDIFVMQKYLQEGELEFLGIHNFDAWAGMFAKKTTDFEIDVDTSSYHLVTRFAKFCNIPELTAILSSIADFHNVKIHENIPQFDGYTDSVREGSEDFKDYLNDISNRADDVRQKRVSRFDDNLLKITSDGRKAALDMRLIDEAYGLDPESKVFRCAENVYEVYENTRSIKGTQLVFCDSSTPKSGFNLYDELKGLLVAMGIPENQIAFIHDADNDKKRAAVFSKMNKGEISVLVGSTFKMGLGVNVQRRLNAIHHFDVPWRPADMVQREGRILRPGNTNDKVFIFRYITKGSFDAYSWQLLETKQRFISQILSGQTGEREAGDIDNLVLNYAEVKALAVGDPRIKQRVELSNELSRVRILQQDLVQERYENRKELSGLPSKIEKQKELIGNIEKDYEFINSNAPEFTEPGKKAKGELRKLIFEACKNKVNLPYESKIADYRGFEIVIPAGMRPVTSNTRPKLPWIEVRRNASYIVDIESLTGITTRLDNLLTPKNRGQMKKGKESKTDRDSRSDLEKTLEKAKSKLVEMTTRMTVLEENLKSGDDYSKQITELKKKLDELDAEMGVFVL